MTNEPLFPIDMSNVEAELVKAGSARSVAQARLDSATSKTRDVALRALELGVSESRVSRLVGANRETIRKWAGK